MDFRRARMTSTDSNVPPGTLDDDAESARGPGPEAFQRSVKTKVPFTRSLVATSGRGVSGPSW